MEQIISKEELNELKNIKGKARGMALKAVLEFILKEEGEEGLKKLEDTIAELGYPIKYRKMKSMEFYTLALKAVILVASKRLFNYDDKKFQKMGSFGAKLPLVVRRVMKHLFSLERISKESPKIWRTYFTAGDFELVELNKEKRYMVVKLEGFRVHPIECQYLSGLFSVIAQMIVGKEATCQETKCPFRNDEYHEFLLKW